MKAVLMALLLLGSVFPAHAQELVQDERETVKAEVVSVISAEERAIPGTDATTLYQSLRVRILEGREGGAEVTVENDYLRLQEGDVFYLLRTYSPLEGRTTYAVMEPYRMPVLIGLGVLFVASVLIFGGIQGLRGLMALAGSLFFILYLLLPGIVEGYPPLLVSAGVSSLIIILGSYVTHGFTRTTTAAVLGMLVTIILTGLLAYASVYLTRLSGFDTEEAVYLNFSLSGVDLVGILLGGILIGLLGVLYDAAIGQAVSVDELRSAGLSRLAVYTKALRIGREHVGALVNTLAIAYVGASLPLMLLFYASSAGWEVTLNREIFAAEIVRTLVGGIGIVLAVPLTTAIAVFLLVKERKTL